MNWKIQLALFEQNKEWDAAIEFMQQVIRENPNDMDAYLLMNYLLMNLLVEEDYDKSKDQYYTTLIKWYFDESYSKFSENAEYLYLTAKTAVMAEWYFGISQEDYLEMIEKAKKMDPDNLVYKENYYWHLKEKNPNDSELLEFAQLTLNDNSPIQKQLELKGALGEYLLMLKKNWAKRVLTRNESNGMKNSFVIE